jgi:hypothetical protein
MNYRLILVNSFIGIVLCLCLKTLYETHFFILGGEGHIYYKEFTALILLIGLPFSVLVYIKSHSEKFASSFLCYILIYFSTIIIWTFFGVWLRYLYGMIICYFNPCSTIPKSKWFAKKRQE